MRQTRPVNNRMPRRMKKKFKAHFCETEKERKACRVLCQNWFGDWVFSIAEITVTLPRPANVTTIKKLKRSGHYAAWRGQQAGDPFLMEVNTELTRQNLAEWKQELSGKMFARHNVKGYGSTNRDEVWLKDYLGYTTEDAVDGEIECWDETLEEA